MKRIILLIILTFIISSCGRKPDVYEGELFPTTKVMESMSSREIVGVDTATVTFAANSETAQNLKVNDVLMTGVTEKTPYGLLRMVTAIDTSGETVVVHTKDCPIEYAFKKLHVEIYRDVPLNGFTFRGRNAQLKRPLEKGHTSLGIIKEDDSNGGAFNVAVDYYPFNGDGDPSTPEDQVHVTGTLGGGLSYFFGLDIDWGNILTWPPDPKIIPEVKVGFDISADAFAKLQAEGIVAKTFKKEDTWDTVYLDPIVAGPLVFLPEIDMKTKIEGASTGTFSFTLDESGSFSAGASYSTEDGPELSLPIPDFTAQQPDVSVMQTANVKVNIGPRVHLKLYGVAGPYATAWAFAGIEADSAKTPCWDVKGGFEGDIGFDISLLSLHIVDWSKDFNIADETLLSGDCDLGNVPPGGVTDVTDPTFTPWSERIEDTATSFNFADSYTGMSQSVDGRYLLSGDSVNTLTKMDKNGSIIWAKKFVVTDAAAPVPLVLPVVLNTLDAGILAAGYSPHVIMKLDAAGEIIWSKEFDVSEHPADGFSAGLEDGAGNVYLAGTLFETGDSATDAWLVKIDQAGNVLWSKTWGAASRRETPTALVLLDNDIVLVGRSSGSQQSPSGQSFVVRITPDGGLVWQRDIAAQDFYGDLFLTSAIRSKDGDIIAGGFFNFSQPKSLLMKIKTDGSFGWATANAGDYLGPAMNSFVQLSDGGYLSCGTWWSAGIDHIWLSRLDSIGRILWKKQFDDGGETATPSVCLTGEGGALLTAYTAQGSEGSSLWSMRVPVKTGDISFPAGSGVSVTSPAWTEQTTVFDVKPSSINGLVDAAVPFSNVELTETDVSPAVKALAP